MGGGLGRRECGFRRSKWTLSPTQPFPERKGRRDVGKADMQSDEKAEQCDRFIPFRRCRFSEEVRKGGGEVRCGYCILFWLEVEEQLGLGFG